MPKRQDYFNPLAMAAPDEFFLREMFLNMYRQMLRHGVGVMGENPQSFLPGTRNGRESSKHDPAGNLTRSMV
jgi:hypothetical protein